MQHQFQFRFLNFNLDKCGVKPNICLVTSFVCRCIYYYIFSSCTQYLPLTEHIQVGTWYLQRLVFKYWNNETENFRVGTSNLFRISIGNRFPLPSILDKVKQVITLTVSETQIQIYFRSDFLWFLYYFADRRDMLYNVDMLNDDTFKQKPWAGLQNIFIP